MVQRQWCGYEKDDDHDCAKTKKMEKKIVVDG